MPLPTPNPGETMDEFISRFMSNPTAIEDFPDASQRRAVAQSKWEKAKMEATTFEVNIAEIPDKSEEVPINSHVTLIRDPDTYRVHAFKFCNWTMEEAQQWLLFGREGVKLEDKQIFAPEIESVMDKVALQDNMALAVGGAAITVGTHKSFKFGESVVDKIATMFNKGVNIVANHRFEDPDDVLGRIYTGMFDGSRAIVTGLITTAEAIKRVESGEFHSFSTHVIVEADSANEKGERVVLEPLALKELTLTSNPADKNAVIETFRRVPLPAVMEDNSPPPVTEAIQQIKERGTMTEEPITAEASVELEAMRKQLDEFKTELEAERTARGEAEKAAVTEKAELEKELATLKTDRRLENAKNSAEKLVFDKKISKAQLESAGLLIASLAEHQVPLWDKFVENSPGIEPLGGVELDEQGGSGMVSSKNEVTDLTKLDQAEFDMLKVAALTEAWEKQGGAGLEHQKKHMNVPMFGVYPVKDGE